MKSNRYSTVRGLIRMSWSKYNLYNLAKRSRYPDLSRRTLFQQMWAAKKEARAYHGENVTEKQFKKIWAMEPLPVPSQSDRKMPPTQTLTFAQIERRLDVVVFRSHFAPSVNSARQIISHGKAAVNGKTVKSSTYLLKDGDVVTIQPSAIPILHRPKESPSKDKATAKSSPESKSATKVDSTTSTVTSSLPSKARNPISHPNQFFSTLYKFTPRPYQQPWMFLPDYLEVNYKTCSVVFIRSPMVKPGRCEIPSPFPQEVHGFAHEYYSKRV
ncbi:hypothetical protein BKA69DRAFT_1121253 [Paraphysoderma sedebokerense]|nr:hypothetical protein BKA69DRAFT_1121253 [Paraphysoderma sedebokerense]